MKVIWPLIFMLLLSSCVGLATKPNLPEIGQNALSIPQSKKPLKIYIKTFTYLKYTDSKSIYIYFDRHFQEAAMNIFLKRSNSNITYIGYSNDFQSFNFKGENYEENFKNYAAVAPPIDADYLIQFVDTHEHKHMNPNHGTVYLGLLHIFTLGLIPLTYENEFNIKTSIFNKKGELISESIANDKARSWYWLPLIFSKRSKFWDQNVHIPVLQNTIENSFQNTHFLEKP